MKFSCSPQSGRRHVLRMGQTKHVSVYYSTPLPPLTPITDCSSLGLAGQTFSSNAEGVAPPFSRTVLRTCWAGTWFNPSLRGVIGKKETFFDCGGIGQRPQQILKSRFFGGGFKHFLFSPQFGEDEPILTNIFQMG